MILVNMISMEFTIISLLLELELLFAVIGIRIWSKCDWYGHGEQYANFFRNLEKKCDKQNQICKFIFDEEEIDKDFEILCKIRSFY